jgi:hypothetical protein
MTAVNYCHDLDVSKIGKDHGGSSRSEHINVNVNVNVNLPSRYRPTACSGSEV